MPHMPGHTNQDLPNQPLPAMRRGAVNLYNFLQGAGRSLPQLATMNSRNDRMNPLRKPPAKTPGSLKGSNQPSPSLPALPVSRDPSSIMNPYGKRVTKGQQPRKPPSVQSGLVPKNPDQLFPYLNSESTQPITMDSLREPERRGDPIPQAVPSAPMPQFGPRPKFTPPVITPDAGPVPKVNPAAAPAPAYMQGVGSPLVSAPAPAPQASLQPSGPVPANERKTDPNLAPGFAEIERQMEAGTLPFQVDQQRRMDEYAQRTAGTPQRPGVDEELLKRLPSRSERDRAMMQPGAMGFTEPVEDDGYAFKGSGATPGTRFDAGMFRNRQDQIDFLDKRVADHMAQADESGVVTSKYGAKTTIDSDPSSPTYGRKTVTGTKARERTSEELAETQARKAARASGSVYTDSDGNVTDYGQLNKNREAYREREAARKERARELRTRRAQLMNYGRTGGAIVNPSGGIAGPMHVGFQPRFGPNMSLNQATLMAQRQLDQFEQRDRDRFTEDRAFAEEQRQFDENTAMQRARQRQQNRQQMGRLGLDQTMEENRVAEAEQARKDSKKQQKFENKLKKQEAKQKRKDIGKTEDIEDMELRTELEAQQAADAGITQTYLSGGMRHSPQSIMEMQNLLSSDLSKDQKKKFLRQYYGINNQKQLNIYLRESGYEEDHGFSFLGSEDGTQGSMLNPLNWLNWYQSAETDATRDNIQGSTPF